MTYDSIIAGAGFAGAVTARVLAEAGRRVLVLEQRPHVGGNAFDCLDESGILIHQYGPHIFHTNDKTVFDFLSRFTAWRTYEHRSGGKSARRKRPHGTAGALQPCFAARWRSARSVPRSFRKN